VDRRFSDPAFDAVTGRLEGRLRDPSDNPIVIDGLWEISFGAGQPSPQTSGPRHTANSPFYADDLAALTAQLDLKGAVHVGHSIRISAAGATEKSPSLRIKLLKD
jgi:pimeloyl-ACP methyl ester carboxylesterase